MYDVCVFISDSVGGCVRILVFSKYDMYVICANCVQHVHADLYLLTATW